MSQFNNGNVSFELQIQNNTLVSNLGKFQIMSSNNTKPNRVQLSDVLNTTKLVKLEGYVKSNFASIHNSKLNKTIGCGSITDGVYKLEVHIIDFNEDNYHKELIQKGNKIELTGIIQNTDLPYLMVNTTNDIKKIEGFMSISSLLKGTKSLKKRMIENNEEPQITVQIPTTTSSGSPVDVRNVELWIFNGSVLDVQWTSTGSFKLP
ncbi:uncharacterized protein LOC118644643 [Monomorium pharaonis]|uniref:uncharacterized protein LOC118644643 n=1 Tax=Monomorium pharaonis TaxID=307658 RepID=UPI001747A46B|nr:uncharacterized protein LOC118644643 [Monomorium pharaonis]